MHKHLPNFKECILSKGIEMGCFLLWAVSPSCRKWGPRAYPMVSAIKTCLPQALMVFLYVRCGLLKISCTRSCIPWSVEIAFVDLKQTDYQIFLQQRWVCLGSAENCSLESATLVSYVQVPTRQGKENAFIEGEKEAGRAIVNMSPWLSIG